MQKKNQSFQNYRDLDPSSATRFHNYARTLRRRDCRYWNSGEKRELSAAHPSPEPSPLDELERNEQHARADEFLSDHRALIAKYRRTRRTNREGRRGVRLHLAELLRCAGFENAALVAERLGQRP